MNVIIRGSDGVVSHIVVDGINVTDLINRFRIEFSTNDNSLNKLKCDLGIETLAQGVFESMVEELNSK